LATASAATDIPAAEAVLFARGRDAAQALIDLIDGLRSNGNETGPLLDALITETTNCWLKESLGGFDRHGHPPGILTSNVEAEVICLAGTRGQPLTTERPETS
jgi:hypothetical protein